MLKRSSFRACVALLASFQLAMSVAVPVADAALESASVELPIHIESEHESGCAPAHDHSFCQLCRTIGLAGSPLGGGAVLRVQVPIDLGCAPTEASAPRTKSNPTGPVGPRAPPVA